MSENNTIILPQVEIVNSVSESANLLVENNGSIKRFPFSEIDVDIDLSDYATLNQLKEKEAIIYRQAEAPEEAPEGSLWLDTDEEGGSGVSSWNDLTDKPDIPTDDHINALIDAKLGVIENGAY